MDIKGPESRNKCHDKQIFSNSLSRHFFTCKRYYKYFTSQLLCQTEFSVTFKLNAFIFLFLHLFVSKSPIKFFSV